MDILALLNQSELFAGLSGENLTEIVVSGKEYYIEKGELLFSEGDEGLSFFVLLEGSVKLYRTSEDGREIIVRILKEGEIFGEVILFVNRFYPVSSEALEKTRLFSIAKKSFLKLMEHEYFRNEFMAVIMKKQRYLSNRIHTLMAYDVEDRFFLYLRESYGEKERYFIDLSKKDLASAIGTIPETLSRLTARLKKRGLIEWNKKELILRENFWSDYD